MFEGLILRELTKEELHRPLRAREILGTVLFIASFGAPAAIILAIQVNWLRVIAIVVWVAAVPFYTRAVIGKWRASRERGRDRPVPPNQSKEYLRLFTGHCHTLPGAPLLAPAAITLAAEAQMRQAVPISIMDQIDTFESLADAARASFPTKHCRILTMREHGDVGYVLFDAKPGVAPYLYGVNYERVNGRWKEGSSSNGDGWSHMGPDPNLGTLCLWDTAPAGADRVRVDLNGQIREEAVENGVYLLVWWGVPINLGLWRTSFRINGQWT